MLLDFAKISALDLQNHIESCWTAAAQKPNVLRYQLKIEQERQIEGACGFLIQVRFIHSIQGPILELGSLSIAFPSVAVE